MITSALISQLRREYRDIPKSVRVERASNGLVNLFSLGKYPVIEGSYAISVGTSAYTEGTNPTRQFQIDLDAGELQINSTPANGLVVKSQHKYAHWRDKNWNEAVNQGIEYLNARGFFRQVIRQQFTISAGVRTIAGPSACVDLYELLYAPSSGVVSKLPMNWSYQQDANKIVLGNSFSTPVTAFRSYLRNMQTYAATSATVDVPTDWVEAVKKKAGAIYYRSLAGHIAQQGNATINEGHFSFTNARAMANDLDNACNDFSTRKKPTRPAKDVQWNLATGGVA